MTILENVTPDATATCTPLQCSTVDRLPWGASIVIHRANQKSQTLRSKIESKRPDITVLGFVETEPEVLADNPDVINLHDKELIGQTEAVTNQTNWVQTACAFVEAGYKSLHVLPTFDPNHAMRNAIVIDSARVIFVPIYKCAYSSFTEFFRQTFAEFSGTQEGTSLNSFIDLVDPAYKDYFKFSVVRDPVARAFSCFNDKYARRDGHGNTEKWKKPLLKLLGRQDLTFLEWLAFICTVPETHSDLHWRSQYFALHDTAGQQLVDAVYPLEQLPQHLDEISEKLGAPIQLQKLNATKRAREHEAEAKEMLRQRYESDFIAFGY